MIVYHYFLRSSLSSNRTALHLACERGHPEIVMLLLQKQCLFNVVDEENTTPLIQVYSSQLFPCAEAFV